MGRKSYAALRHQCGLAGLSQQGDREAMQKRLQRLRLQPRTQMSITELTGALRDLGQKTHRNQRSKKDLQRLLAKNESCAEMIHALRGFGQRIPRNQRSKKDLQRLLAKRLAQSQATTQNLPFNRLSEGSRLQRVRLLPRTKMSRAEMIHSLRDFGQSHVSMLESVSGPVYSYLVDAGMLPNMFIRRR